MRRNSQLARTPKQISAEQLLICSSCVFFLIHASGGDFFYYPHIISRGVTQVWVCGCFYACRPSGDGLAALISTSQSEPPFSQTNDHLDTLARTKALRRERRGRSLRKHSVGYSPEYYWLQMLLYSEIAEIGSKFIVKKKAEHQNLKYFTIFSKKII